LKQKDIPWPHKPGLTKHYSTGLILAVITAIRDAYRIEEISVQEELDNTMNNFYKMYCKFIGREKMLERYSVQVGRSAIPSSAFRISSIPPPADIARELSGRRKIKGVMEILQGETTLRTVDLDPAYAWKQCWGRCVAVLGLKEKRARVLPGR